MQEKRSFYLLLTIMGVIALTTLAVTNIILYRVAFEEKSQSLIQSAQSQARLIEAMARYNKRTNRVDWELPVGERGPTSLLSERAAADTIAQLKDAHDNYIGFGETGEFVLAGIEDQQIVFLLSHRHQLNSEPEPVPLYSKNAEPIRRALMVESGVMVGKDYRGVEVLAAYEPVDVLNFGIVAKIDMAEIRAPFIQGTIYTSIVSMLLIFLGSMIFRAITNPIIDKIRTSEMQYRSLVEDIAEWVWQTDSTGKLNFSSPVLANILGYQHAEVIAQPFTQVIHTSNRASVHEKLTHNNANKVIDIPVVAETKHGELKYIELNASPIYSSEGEFSGYRGVARDITERIQAEKLRREYQTDLERTVEERTRELNDINEEMKSFTYIVSHDLRSPLVSIVGFSTELKEDISVVQSQLRDIALPEKTKNMLYEMIPESVHFIDKAAEKMDGLIKSILALSRLGVRELQYEEVDTQKIVNLNLDAIAYQLENVNVTVGNMPTIYSDETSLTQIFGNLIGNAVKYLKPNMLGEINIDCQEDSQNWIFSVKDNGRGIAEKDQSHIFELFARVGEQHIQGEGMGLTYVQTMVRRLGGRIECISQLEKGSTFRFYLPKKQ